MSTDSTCRITEAAILAGGFGTRLRSVVSDRPKVLAEVNGRPFLAALLERLAALGIRRVVLCTGHLAQQVRAFGESHCGGVELVFSEETQPMGTGGALRLALPHLLSENVLVLNGDSFYRGNLAPFLASHLERRAAISLLLSRVPDASRFGSVHTAPGGEILGFHEKDPSRPGPGWVNAGVYAARRDVIAAIPPGQAASLEKQVFPAHVGRGLFGWRGDDVFLDIGTPESYAEAAAFLARPAV